jgi:hypothetical protein
MDCKRTLYKLGSRNKLLIFGLSFTFLYFTTLKTAHRHWGYNISLTVSSLTSCIFLNRRLSKLKSNIVIYICDRCVLCKGLRKHKFQCSKYAKRCFQYYLVSCLIFYGKPRSPTVNLADIESSVLIATH